MNTSAQTDPAQLSGALHAAEGDPDRIVADLSYAHPQFTFAAVSTQAELPTLNGTRHTWYCGSYFGHGFHEDAVRAGAQVARAFGVEL